jgi:hypothetical protein
VHCQQQKEELITSPPLCALGCLDKQKQLDFEAKLNYKSKELYIISKSDIGRTTRSRSKKTEIIVDSTDSLHDLKLKICQLLYVIPLQQKLSLDNKPIEGDELSLAQHGIPFGSTLVLETIDEIEEGTCNTSSALYFRYPSRKRRRI